jgi:lipopolysaccharide export system protein LptA
MQSLSFACELESVVVNRWRSPIKVRPVWVWGVVLAACLAIAPNVSVTAQAQRRALTLRANLQQANAKTGIVTASGNVQLSYPARQIQATADVAQYYSRERRIILSGNVYVLQAGNSLRANTITYLIDEGRFVATPANQQQVEAILLVPDEEAPLVEN